MKLTQLQEARYDAPPVDIKKLEKLLDKVAESIPFINYEGAAYELSKEVAAAFKEATGMSWSDWRKR